MYLERHNYADIFLYIYLYVYKWCYKYFSVAMEDLLTGVCDEKWWSLPEDVYKTNLTKA